jgi:anti-anti-sigma regulatory factor
MLRITIHDNLEAVTFRLEGKLAGPWAHALAECWLTTLAQRPRAAVRIDLAAVTYVDGAGKEILTAMHHRGAELVAADCLMKAVVAEITNSPPALCRKVRQQAVMMKGEKR